MRISLNEPRAEFGEPIDGNVVDNGRPGVLVGPVDGRDHVVSATRQDPKRQGEVLNARCIEGVVELKVQPASTRLFGLF